MTISKNDKKQLGAYIKLLIVCAINQNKLLTDVIDNSCTFAPSYKQDELLKHRTVIEHCQKFEKLFLEVSDKDYYELRDKIFEF